MKASSLMYSCSVAMLIAGCVSPSQMLVGPQGDVRRCAANGWGYIGAPLAEHSVHNCVADLKGLGYVPVEAAGTLGLQLSQADAKVAIVTLIAPNSPASHAGMQPGDQIVKVNGQPVLDRAAAMTMMFGKVGDTVNLSIKRGETETVFPLRRVSSVVASN